MFKKILSVSFVLGLLSSLLLAKSALCTVESNHQIEFHGNCDFQSEQGGSFSIAQFNPNQPLYGPILSVSVYIVQRGIAEVRGLTTDGINSRWGEARRSQDDPACWIGSDFKICAR
ncbi:MAG: hypothetical protein JXQ76_02770 [Campylobacterales bacterium]|nr:hypothetical protein [Campylobacterales bacterium]